MQYRCNRKDSRISEKVNYLNKKRAKKKIIERFFQFFTFYLILFDFFVIFLVFATFFVFVIFFALIGFLVLTFFAFRLALTGLAFLRAANILLRSFHHEDAGEVADLTLDLFTIGSPL
jgi:hypothetical protein